MKRQNIFRFNRSSGSKKRLAKKVKTMHPNKQFMNGKPKKLEWPITQHCYGAINGLSCIACDLHMTDRMRRGYFSITTPYD